jgi:6-phosphogluconolactonase
VSRLIPANRRVTGTVAGCLLLGGLLAAAARPASSAEPAPAATGPLPANTTLAYVGTFTKGESKGIYVFRLQTQGLEVSQNITLVPLGLAAATPNPAFLEVDTRRRLVFAANDLHEFEGKPSGAVSAFSVDATTGKLVLLNQRPSMGPAPCHLTLDKDGRNLLVANCIGGSVAVLPVAADGKLGAATSVVQHPGTKPHTHGVALSPDNRFAFACDMGLDRVMSYRFDASKGILTPNDPATIAMKAGTGPRHLVFRPDGRYAYVVGSKKSSVTTFAFDGKTGGLREQQTVSSLPESFEGQSSAAEVAVHPSGKFLYVSNRGHNSVVLFAIDADKGTLTFVEEQGTGGKTPRHFGLEPSAKHLAIANQDSNTVLASRVDAGNGRLKPSGVFANVPSPVCVKFLPPRETPKAKAQAMDKDKEAAE